MLNAQRAVFKLYKFNNITEVMHGSTGSMTFDCYCKSTESWVWAKNVVFLTVTMRLRSFIEIYKRCLPYSERDTLQLCYPLLSTSCFPYHNLIYPIIERASPFQIPGTYLRNSVDLSSWTFICTQFCILYNFYYICRVKSDIIRISKPSVWNGYRNQVDGQSIQRTETS